MRGLKNINIRPVVANIVGTRDNHRYWFMTAALAFVTLISLTSHLEDWTSQTTGTKWSVIGIALIMILTSLAVVGHVFFVDRFADTKIEGGATVAVCGIWATILPVMMTPRNNLAVDTDGNLLNANMYFFAWIGAFLSFVLLGRFVEMRLLSVGATDARETHNYRVTSWAGLAITSLVVVIESSRLLNGGMVCDDPTGGAVQRCTRTRYAVAISVLTFLITIAWIGMTTYFKNQLPSGPRIHVALMGLMVAFWTVGMLVVTFGGEKAPATNLGNLYLFTWGSFCISASMAMDAIKESRADADQNNENEEEADENDGNANEGDNHNVEKSPSVETLEEEGTEREEDGHSNDAQQIEKELAV